ncbi:MAG TPA: LytTR family DNA-binding domain-containing protein [Hydrogenophaga sp.]|uniref:LytR/AlgR family response regulator transcription factor n=1 Tax=Hydrogenophaga sp. TaxID=1904254 RepID=UPI002BF123B2|nr:LytTR family DNA-binding domain-containing protein [Hydrogenophaga sp.]HMN93320.1 LytTR family DNA-binding domain-containing protein [Hydrogenophaga sp.]HMP10685.1 LytTR family DNA-binding domain-containing protein [Hydrogenophaga sp.]
MKASALIAEDEPLLALALKTELAQAWPDLSILASVGDGQQAVSQSLALMPDVLFLDIRMPGQTGLEAAAELAEEWPASGPFPLIVFVTAYDQYALQAFEAQAVDYLLKPVQALRLRQTVLRLQQQLQWRASGPGTDHVPRSGADPLEHTLHQLRQLMAPGALTAVPVAEPLTLIQAGVGSQIRFVPVDEVLAFEAADKYVRVLTADGEVLIRTPLKELLPRLSAQRFWQIHRGTVVNATAIDRVERDHQGRLHLRLTGRTETWTVSRLYAHRFKAM